MVTVTLSNDEALVLFEFLSRGACRELPKDPAEERVLSDLECMLEARIDVAFRPDYGVLVEQARERLRDKLS
jgi:hypothetical protein